VKLAIAAAVLVWKLQCPEGQEHYKITMPPTPANPQPYLTEVCWKPDDVIGALLQTYVTVWPQKTWEDFRKDFQERLRKQGRPTW
jgi:hypothetical protein